MKILNAAQQILMPLLEAKIRGGFIGPRPRRELRNWEKRTEPHVHAGERARRKRQQKRQEARASATRTLSRTHAQLTKSAIRREIRRFPHVHL